MLAAYGGRLPYELLIAPLGHPDESAFESELLAPALGLVSESLRRLHVLEGPAPAKRGCAMKSSSSVRGCKYDSRSSAGPVA